MHTVYIFCCILSEYQLSVMRLLANKGYLLGSQNLELDVAQESQ